VLAGERPEALTGGLVRAERALVCVLRVGGDLLGHGKHLAAERGVMGGVTEKSFDPALGAVVGGNVVVEEQLAEQQSTADVRERAEGEDPVRRLDQGGNLRVLALNLPDDRAERLVDERDPEVVEICHAWIMAAGGAPARQFGPRRR